MRDKSLTFKKGFERFQLRVIYQHLHLTGKISFPKSTIAS